jgi:hypothetical protein
MADLKQVRIAADTNITIGTVQLGQEEIVEHVLNTHELFNSSAVGIKASIRLSAKFKGAQPGDTVLLDEADWQLLVKAFESPTQGYYAQLEDPRTGDPVTIPGRVFLPYIESLSEDNVKLAH